MSPEGRRTRAYDVVLFGATGFTGSLTASYLARHAPPGMRWAIAGRDVSRLQSLAEQLSAHESHAGSVDVIRADSADPAHCVPWPSPAGFSPRPWGHS